MKHYSRFLLFTAFLLFSFAAPAQKYSVYAALKAGLSIREQPSETAKVIGKIPYGAALTTDTKDVTATRIITEGFSGYWTRVSYKGVTGYVVGSYLIPLPPPKAGTKTMLQYLQQLSPKAGAPVVVKKGKFTGGGVEEDLSEMTKQLYKNGASHHSFIAHEYNADTYFLPDMEVKDAFLIVRLIAEFKNEFAENDPFPTGDKKFTRGDAEYELKLDREPMSDGVFWIKRIRLDVTQGSITTMEIFNLDGEVVINISSGV